VTQAKHIAFARNLMNQTERLYPRLVLLIVLTAGCSRSPVAPVDQSPSHTGNGAGATNGTTGKADVGAESKGIPFEATGGIDPKAVAAWERAGARFGWLVSSLDPILSPEFSSSRPQDRPSLPAFQFTDKDEVSRGLRELPAPSAPFGLDFSNARFADADLKTLCRFQELQALNLLRTQITGAGLRELAGLPGLQVLILNVTHITDADLNELTAVPQLQSLSLGVTDIGDEGLRNLAGLKQLHTLRLFGTKITDRGMLHLVALEKLQVLDLHLTKISDVGLKELARCEQLQTVFVAGTDVTDRGRADLRKALPKCEVRQ
jgi:hypothetical protein